MWKIDLIGKKVQDQGGRLQIIEREDDGEGEEDQTYYSFEVKFQKMCTLNLSDKNLF